jgi:lactoylglutathione lyase
VFRSIGVDLVTLELTHNYGTESLEGPVYHPGNAMASEALEKNGRDGFGHIAFNVPDVYKYCDDLVAKEVPFHKLPDEGRMKGLAFALDPDGYWVEIVTRGESKEAKEIENAANLSQTMLRVKDPVKSIAFYQHLGMTLLRTTHGSDFSLFFLANLTPELQQRFEAQVSLCSNVFVQLVFR